MGHPHRRVVIVGAGFGGLAAARALARRPVRVTLVDRKNHHTFQPLLYQVATTVLSPGQIAYPIRAILRGRANVDVILGEVTGIDTAARRVALDGRSLDYDYLIVATGASHSYFGHPEWEALAPGLKTVEDALEIRRRVLLAFELAERDADTRTAAGAADARRMSPGADVEGAGAEAEGPKVSPRAEAPAAQAAAEVPAARAAAETPAAHVRAATQAPPVTFVVVGGGPTGVELAGALADIARRALARDFRAVDPRHARIVLVEGGPRILPALPEDLSRSAAAHLTRLGVEVRTSAPVTAIEPGAVRVGDEVVASTVTIWAAGVAASPLGTHLGLVDRAGRIRVAPDLSLPGRPEVFVIGDLAACAGEDGRLLPGLGAVADQQGKAAAENVWRDISGRAKRPFRYADKGNLATIGRKVAVAQFGRLHVSGFIAWVLWLFVHLLLLVGFRNRLAVLSEWAWAYFTSERSAMLITGSTSLPGWSDRGAPSGEADTPPGR